MCFLPDLKAKLYVDDLMVMEYWKIGMLEYWDNSSFDHSTISFFHFSCFHSSSFILHQSIILPIRFALGIVRRWHFVLFYSQIASLANIIPFFHQSILTHSYNHFTSWIFFFNLLIINIRYPNARNAPGGRINNRIPSPG